MSWLDGLRARARALWGRHAAERELDDELQFHIAMETDAGGRRGLSPDEARRRALVAFGGVERYREQTRDARGFTWLSEARADLRHAWRMVVSHPAFAAAVIGTLALGIGADTAIFSVVNAVLLQPSPFADADRLVMVWETDRGSGTRHEPASWPDVADFRERSRTLAAIGAVAGRDFTVSDRPAGEPRRVPGVRVTPNLPALLGVRPLAGRLFTPRDGAAGDQPVVMLGEGYWRTHFHADPGVVGRTILLDEQPALVVGVLPAAADLGLEQVHDRADYAPAFGAAHAGVWQAIQPTITAFPRETHGFLTIARLAPGATVAAAQREMAAIAADLERTYPENAKRGVNLESYHTVVFGAARPALALLFGAVTLVLLVTCANVANLLLARTATRTREVAVRVALGAGQGRIARQFLVESLLFVALGAALGIGLAAVGVPVLTAVAPGTIPRIDTTAVDGRVLAYAIGVAGLIAVAFGMLPAVLSHRLDVQRALKSEGGGRRLSPGHATRRFRDLLVVAEVALAVTLVVGAGLLLRSLWRLQRVDPGFDAARVLKVEYQLPPTRYPFDLDRFPDLPQIIAFHTRFLDAVRALPDVRSAALAGGSPLDPGFTSSFRIVGREAESSRFPEIRIRFLTPGYLQTLGVPLLRGRPIGAGDDVHAPLVILINRTAAQRYFPNVDPIGQQIRFWSAPRRIVGVIGDEKFEGVGAPSEPAVYAALAQAPQPVATLLVRTTSRDPMALLPAIREAMRTIDPQIALFGAEPLEHTLAASMDRPRFDATLLGLFAGLAMLLAVIGIYGVLSYTVAERSTELGIRIALGADRGEVMRMVLVSGLWLAGSGVAIGLATALAGSRLLASLIFGIAPTDPATFAVVAIGGLATALAAMLLPALRATRADPMVALRAEA